MIYQLKLELKGNLELEGNQLVILHFTFSYSKKEIAYFGIELMVFPSIYTVYNLQGSIAFDSKHRVLLHCKPTNLLTVCLGVILSLLVVSLAPG